MLEILADPQHDQHEEMTAWVGLPREEPFDPESFNPATVTFSDPGRRFRKAFAKK